jgi:ferredoxin
MSFVLVRSGLRELVHVLEDEGFEVHGPVVVDHAIRYAPISSIDDVAIGIRDVQGPGTYALTERSDDAMFGHTVGVSSLKDLFFPPRRQVWSSVWDGETYTFEPAPGPAAKLAVIGARACELAALGIHDRVLAEGDYVDADYVRRRADSFIVSVDCTEPGEVCFCASMGTGPAATVLFDLAVTEVSVDGAWEYVGRYGSERGEAILERVTHRQPDQIEISLARSAVSSASDQMGRELSTTGLPEYLAANREHPHWAAIAERCLACGNCTQACPTCFCVSTVDTSSLDGTRAERAVRWDSCFSLDYSYMGGRPLRSSIDARYRKWLTHKLSGWVEQFGTSGCVGCGRCITWCPVGIDFTAEIPKMMELVDA